MYKGGKARIDPQLVRKLAAEGMRPSHIARQLGISRGTVYRFMPKRFEAARVDETIGEGLTPIRPEHAFLVPRSIDRMFRASSAPL